MSLLLKPVTTDLPNTFKSDGAMLKKHADYVEKK